MATITSNIESLRIVDGTSYGKFVNKTRDEYDENMRIRFGYDEICEDYIDECRYYEVDMLDNTEYEALEAITEDRTAIQVARIMTSMMKAVMEFHEREELEIDSSKLENIGKLYTLWRYVVTNDVQYEIEE